MTVAARHMQLSHTKRKQHNVINLHLEFMRRTQIGEAIFTVKDVKLGSRISNLHVTLSQIDERTNTLVDEVQGYITVSNISSEDGLSLDTGYEVHPEPLTVSLPSLAENNDKNYIRRGPDLFANFRKAGRHIAMHLIRPSQRPSHFPKALIDQWIMFEPHGKKGRFTNDSMGLVVDIFPQIIEQYVNPEMEEALLNQGWSQEQADEFKKKTKPNASYWYPTLTLNLDVKKSLPEEGVEWLFVRVQAMKIQNGRFDLLIQVLDDKGDMIALSQHASLAVDSSRNLTRAKKDKGSKL